MKTFKLWEKNSALGMSGYRRKERDDWWFDWEAVQGITQNACSLVARLCPAL